MENKECPSLTCKGKLRLTIQGTKYRRYECDKCECKVEEPIK